MSTALAQGWPFFDDDNNPFDFLFPEKPKPVPPPQPKPKPVPTAVPSAPERQEPAYLHGGKPTTSDYYRSMMEWTLYKASKFGKNTSDCPLCASAAGLEGTSPSQECLRTYNEFYKIKPRKSQETQQDAEIDVRISIGYLDDRLVGGDVVDDWYVGPLIRDQLTTPCRAAANSACGFEQDADDAAVFRKRLEMIGPDGQKRFRYVKLRIFRSSAGPSDSANQSAEKREEQKQITESAREFFADSLQHGDMVLYIGHGRSGGGPDFGPPKTRGQKPPITDLDWYRKNHPGRDLMYQALKETSTPPKILGIFACYAKEYFTKDLRQVAPNTGLVLSGNTEFFSETGQALAMLDSVLGRRCENEFKAALEIPQSIKLYKNTNDIHVESVHVENVFRAASTP